MATRHRIDNAIRNVQMGDVEKYFTHLNNIIEPNSGVHDCKIISHDCDNTSAPFRAGSFTKFKLTDTAMDIVDLSKGYITMDVEMDVKFDWNPSELYKETNTFNKDARTSNYDAIKPVFFIGFKSAAHIIEVYNVYSNGVLTNCKQTHAKEEQTITYLSKAKEERVGRPGMYTTHEKVREMSDCVCGAYIRPSLTKSKAEEPIRVKFSILIQIDDLLPFSACEYYPRFLTGDLELQISTQITQNMVFCQLPLSIVLTKREIGLSELLNSDDWKKISALLISHKDDNRFTQCGDYANCIYPYREPEGSEYYTTTIPTTIRPTNLVITEAKSFIHGFNIKDSVKQNIANMYGDKNLVIPAQWVEHYTFSQLPSTRDIRANMQLSMNNACQLIMTFPNKPNQLTVSRNPHLEAVQCQVADRIVPDKFFSTLDKAHAEMIIENLNLDSLFSAPDELIEALTKDRGEVGSLVSMKIDDSDYMLVINLERFGNGCYCDGLSGVNIPINLQANFMYGTKNPHYYKPYLDNDNIGESWIDGVGQPQAGTPKYHSEHINLFVVSDAFWVCNRNGCQFIKDVSVDK